MQHTYEAGNIPIRNLSGGGMAGPRANGYDEPQFTEADACAGDARDIPDNEYLDAFDALRQW